MKKKIKIDFSDFWGGYNKTDNYFYNLLKEDFDVEISSNPDFLFFSFYIEYFDHSHTSIFCHFFNYVKTILPLINDC